MDKKSSFQEAPHAFKHADSEAHPPVVSPSEVPVKEAKAKLTELLRRVEAGERITLTRHGKPVADLVPNGQGREKRPMSVMERYRAWHSKNPPLGIGWVSPNFDDPLPEDFLLQPLPDDFDEKLAEHDRRIDEARRKRDEQGG
jgi:prevent-host-death family protein